MKGTLKLGALRVCVFVLCISFTLKIQLIFAPRAAALPGNDAIVLALTCRMLLPHTCEGRPPVWILLLPSYRLLPFSLAGARQPHSIPPEA